MYSETFADEVFWAMPCFNQDWNLLKLALNNFQASPPTILQQIPEIWLKILRKKFIFGNEKKLKTSKKKEIAKTNELALQDML